MFIAALLINLFYRHAFKNKSSVYLGWPQKGLNVEKADLSGDEELPPGPQLSRNKQASNLHGFLCVESEPQA